ncbi:head decoration protein (plasmid) [Vibrio metschnikovii]|uniref:head decoration protein n=1 Tax=Vibrio metschnikovii TaxID=28172 RepID=UPI00315DF55F
MREETEYTPNDYLIGAPVTTRAALKSGVSYSKLTPLMFDKDDVGKLVPWDATPGKAIAMSATNVESASSGQLAAVYTAGGFRMSFVNWPEGAETELIQRSAFLGSATHVDDEY